MAHIELVLLQRVEKLGQMGEVVKVRPGYARNFLLPQKKALRATKDNLARFESQRLELEAQNLKRREEAERIAERVAGLRVMVVRQAGDSGSLYGSVSARDIADACGESGLSLHRSQVVLEHPIKTIGLKPVKVALHPEVSITVTVNVARSPEEAEKQLRGEAVGAGARAQGDAEADAERDAERDAEADLAAEEDGEMPEPAA
jgi:large subunit ribosomal protein L9